MKDLVLGFMPKSLHCPFLVYFFQGKFFEMYHNDIFCEFRKFWYEITVAFTSINISFRSIFRMGRVPSRSVALMTNIGCFKS